MECEPTGNTRWTGGWVYERCVPDDVQQHTGPDGVHVGVAMKAIFIWKRRFAREYVCCPGENERRVWVDGNYAIYTFERYDAGYTTIGIDVGIPVPGVAKEVLDLLGIRIQPLQFSDPRAVDAERPPDPEPDEGGNGIPVEAGVPTADCGKRVVLPNGDAFYWWSSELGRPPAPDEGTAPPPPPPASQVPELTPEPAARPCCAEYHGRTLAPTFTVVRHDVRRNGTSVMVDVRLEWTHRCGLVARPQVQFFFVYPGQSAFELPKPPQLSKGMSADETTYHWEITQQQLQVPQLYQGGGLVVRFRVRSKCGATLTGDYLLARTT